MFRNGKPKQKTEKQRLASVSESFEIPPTPEVDDNLDKTFATDGAQRNFILNKFRIAVYKVINKNKNLPVDTIPDIKLSNDKYTTVTILPTHETKSIYLSQIFKYAVKVLIIKRRKEQAAGDSWNEFFYSVYSPERPKLEDMRRHRSGHESVKINLSEDIEKKLSTSTLDKHVKEKLSPYRSALSASERSHGQGRKAFEDLTRLSANITRQRQRELKESRELDNLCAPNFLPKLKRKSRQFQHGRFERTEDHTSPDGTTPLSRVFFLPFTEKVKNELKILEHV